MALPDQLGGAPIESLADLDAESAHGERTLVTADERRSSHVAPSLFTYC
jgi:hypothetical protein